MTLEQVLLFAALALAPLFGALVRTVRRRLEGETPGDLEPEAPSVPPRVRTPPAPATGTAAGSRESPPAAVRGMVVAFAAADRPAPLRLSSHREVRQGIVLMTILSPCRALEPPDA